MSKFGFSFVKKIQPTIEHLNSLVIKLGSKIKQ